MHVYQEITYFEPRFPKSVTHQNQAQKVDMPNQIRHHVYNTDSTVAGNKFITWLDGHLMRYLLLRKKMLQVPR